MRKTARMKHGIAHSMLILPDINETPPDITESEQCNEVCASNAFPSRMSGPTHTYINAACICCIPFSLPEAHCYGKCACMEERAVVMGACAYLAVAQGRPSALWRPHPIVRFASIDCGNGAIRGIWGFWAQVLGDHSYALDMSLSEP